MRCTVIAIDSLTFGLCGHAGSQFVQVGSPSGTTNVVHRSAADADRAESDVVIHARWCGAGASACAHLP